MTSKILVIGATGYIGKVFVEGSVKSGHTTFALVRESSLTDPVKAELVQSFKDLGVTILYVRGLLNPFSYVCFKILSVFFLKFISGFSNLERFTYFQP